MIDKQDINWLIPGEIVLCDDEIVNGFVYQTNFRFTLTCRKSQSLLYNIPVNLIFKVEVVNLVNLKVYTKLASVFTLSFKSETSASVWSKRLTKHLTINTPFDDIFASVFKKSLDPNNSPHQILLRDRDTLLQTKEASIIHKEFLRLGFNYGWSISEVNKDFKICHSYPRSHIVPKSADDKSIKLMSNFRGHNRFPSVVWRSKYTGAVLLRCSQPCIGLSCSRNEYDEKFIGAVIQSVIEDRTENRIINKDTKYKNGLIIIDARSYSAAQLNRLRGGGLEHPEYYSNCQIEFKDLPNLHNVRQYFEKLINLVESVPNINWFSYLETTNWLTYIGQLLKTSWEISKNIHMYGQPVMVHCTDGWDRTSQLVSLAEILLDPYYRSIRGFQTLIEREWLMFGHKFADRCGNGTGNLSQDERSPIFLQWLDCIFQLTRQFPNEFEFNENFLIKLAIHCYSGLFGTFLFNCERERIRNKVDEKTCSLWSMLTSDYDENWTIFNHSYTGNTTLNYDKILKPQSENRYLTIWLSLYQKGFVIPGSPGRIVNGVSLSRHLGKYELSDDENEESAPINDMTDESSNKPNGNLNGNSTPVYLETKISGNFIHNGDAHSHQQMAPKDSFLGNIPSTDDQIEIPTCNNEHDEPISFNIKRHKSISSSSYTLYAINDSHEGDLDSFKDDPALIRDFDGFGESVSNSSSNEKTCTSNTNGTAMNIDDLLPRLASVDGITIYPDSTTIILREKHLNAQEVDKVLNMKEVRIGSLTHENQMLKEEIERLQESLKKSKLSKSIQSQTSHDQSQPLRIHNLFDNEDDGNGHLYTSKGEMNNTCEHSGSKLTSSNSGERQDEQLIDYDLLPEISSINNLDNSRTSLSPEAKDCLQDATCHLSSSPFELPNMQQSSQNCKFQDQPKTLPQDISSPSSHSFKNRVENQINNNSQTTRNPDSLIQA